MLSIHENQQKIHFVERTGTKMEERIFDRMLDFQSIPVVKIAFISDNLNDALYLRILAILWNKARNSSNIIINFFSNFS